MCRPSHLAGFVRALLAAAMLLPCLAEAEPHQASSAVRIAIRVPPVMQLQLLDHPRTLEVSEQDVARGYVVVRGPRVDVLSNHRAGYRVRAELSGGAFESAELSGLPRAVSIAAAGASVGMPPQVGAPRPAPRAVEYVLRLAASTRAGRHAWPVTLALESP